jgi:feruloyl esterase
MDPIPQAKTPTSKERNAPMTRISLRFLLASSAAAALACAAAPANAAIACADLVQFKIAAKDIGLPNGGATISSAQIATVPADPTMPGATREYCKVLGAVAPLDPNAPPVNFEVNLPMQWNGKAVQYGGGGSNGVLITGLAPLRDARRDTPVPVARGFATWGNGFRPRQQEADRAPGLCAERRSADQHGLRVVQEDA